MEKPVKGWAVDAATSGNPGPSKYRCIDLETKEIVFSQDIGISTNNLAEFCALGHAVLEAKRRGKEIVIYSDSVTAISWLRKGEVNSKMKETPLNKKSLEFVDRIKTKLKQLNKTGVDNTYIMIDNTVHVTKWFTSEWGEIPADYGNKRTV